VPVAVITVAFIAAHSAIYALWLRSTAFGRSEAGVFLYYFGGCVALTITVLILAFAAGWRNPIASAAAAGAATGIYGLSVLELFALSSGGFSLRIVMMVQRVGHASRNEIVEQFVALSDEKKAGRLESLLWLGLATQHGSRFELTRAGRWLAHIFAVLRRLAGYRNAG